MEHIGIDVHKRESQICILTPEGEIIERRVQTTRDRLTTALGTRPPAQVLLEATTESEWVAQTLEACGHEVIVADPNYAPMYPERRRRVKTDRRDARMLAEAVRLGSYRPAHRVSAEQRQVRRQLRVRDVLVRNRGRVISLMRALVRSEGLRVRPGDADRFGTYVQELVLPDELHAAVRPLLAVWDELTDQLAAADATIVATAKANPVVRRLTTAPGVGPLIATAFVATLDRADRFRGAHQVESYLGLVPSEASSADRRRRGHITKAGNPRMRWLLVQSAWAAMRSRRADAAPLRAWAEWIARRRGSRIATVALARRLAGILFAMWRDGTPFDGTRVPVMTPDPGTESTIARRR
jgi:transposase